MNTDIIERLESIETLLLAIVPWHKLTQAQKELVGPIMQRSAPDTVGDREERKKFVKREFLKLINLTAAKRKAAKFPRALIPQDENHVIPPCVPLSILVNRCRARKVFAPVEGEDSAAQNVVDAVNGVGFVQATLEELGVLRFSDVVVVLTTDARSKINPVMFPEEEGDEEENEWEARAEMEPEEETIQADLDRMKAAREAKREETLTKWGAKEDDEEEQETEPVIVKPAKKKEVTFDWSSINKEPVEAEAETFEESDCALGIALIGQDDDDDVVVEDDDDLSDTTDPVDENGPGDPVGNSADDDDNDGWGPDEEEFVNPIREQFEAEAEAAWQREQEALERGDLVLVDGIPVARKSTLKNK